MSYIFYNPNPTGKLIGDCVIRAIAKATDDDWEKAYIRIIVKGYELKDMPSANHVWGSYLKDIGFKRYMIPDTCPNCYTIRDFCNDNPEGLFVVATGSHVVTVLDGNYYDSWDSGNEIPTYYFKK